VSDSACVSIHGYIKSGTGIGNATADMNLLAVRTQRGGALESVVIIDEDGDIYYDGALNNFDDYADEEMARDVQLTLTGRSGRRYDQRAMVEAGIVRVSDSGGVMISHKNLTALQLGAHSQAFSHRQVLEARIIELEKQIEELKK